MGNNQINLVLFFVWEFTIYNFLPILKSNYTILKEKKMFLITLKLSSVKNL